MIGFTANPKRVNLLNERRALAQQRLASKREKQEQLRNDPALNDPLFQDQLLKEINSLSELLHDPIEDDPAIRPHIEQAEALAQAELKDDPQKRDRLNSIKQQILQQRFGITWFTIEEMNPNCEFM